MPPPTFIMPTKRRPESVVLPMPVVVVRLRRIGTGSATAQEVVEGARVHRHVGPRVGLLPRLPLTAATEVAAGGVAKAVVDLVGAEGGIGAGDRSGIISAEHRLAAAPVDDGGHVGEIVEVTQGGVVGVGARHAGGGLVVAVVLAGQAEAGLGVDELLVLVRVTTLSASRLTLKVTLAEAVSPSLSASTKLKPSTMGVVTVGRGV
jgi:hypothetical protein